MRWFGSMVVTMAMTATPALVLVACDDDAEATAEPGAGSTTGEGTADTATTPEPAPEAPAPQAGGAVVEDPTFELRATTTGPYQNGELGQFQIALTPRGEFHVNEEFPIEVTLTAPAGVTLPKSELGQSDCAEFGANAARFEIPFTPTVAGEHRLDAKVSFAVCTPENCVPDERTLAVVLPVE